QSIGLKMSHLGVLIYFAAAFVTFHVTQESNVHLLEGEGTNVSSSYSHWELAFWDGMSNQRQVTAYDVTKAMPGDVFQMDDVRVSVEQFYLNCSAFKTSDNKGKVKNASGISLLEPKAMLKEREKNVAGGVFAINGTPVLLYGLESKPTKIGTHYF